MIMKRSEKQKRSGGNKNSAESPRARGHLKRAPSLQKGRPVGFKKIESPANQKIKDLIALRDDTDINNLWFVEGLKNVQEVIAAGLPIKELFVTESQFSKHAQNLNISFLSRNIVSLISDKVAHKLSGTKSPQGVFALVKYNLKKISALHPSPKSIIPVIDRIQDPGNLGTIIRTADAFGIRDLILLRGTCSPANQKVLRSSAASVFHLNLVIATESELMQWVRRHNISFAIADAGAAMTIRDVPRGKITAIVLGNESSGVSPSLKKQADVLFQVPLTGKAESLNVAITSAIILYELRI